MYVIEIFCLFFPENCQIINLEAWFNATIIVMKCSIVLCLV